VFPAGASAALISDHQQQFNNAKQAFQTFNTVNLASRNNSWPPPTRYLCSLRDWTHDFALVHTCTIITYLLTNYGAISSVDLSMNDECIRLTWTITTPMELLFAQINDGAAYATAGASAYTG
jgi:hypothetical protein